jgi:hypothetical protein
MRKPHSSGGGGNIPPVTGLTATLDGTDIYLKWDTLTGATSYWIYRDNIVIAIYTTTSYIDHYATTAGHTYLYAVAAVVNSVLGPKSASASVTVPA